MSAQQELKACGFLLAEVLQSLVAGKWLSTRGGADVAEMNLSVGWESADDSCESRAGLWTVEAAIWSPWQHFNRFSAVAPR